MYFRNKFWRGIYEKSFNSYTLIMGIKVMNLMNKERVLLKTVKETKLFYLGHIMRGEKYKILRLRIEGEIEGKRSVERRQKSWLKHF